MPTAIVDWRFQAKGHPHLSGGTGGRRVGIADPADMHHDGIGLLHNVPVVRQFTHVTAASFEHVHAVGENPFWTIVEKDQLLSDFP